ncbi:hypothetical protein EYR36_000392 [Pleurotus pulmonarius]|nr:hypothetical protein EYR36_000392 [Pleurotus pulmonarius]
MSELLVAPPPEYNYDEDLSSPMYSMCAGSSERVIQFEPFKRTGCPDCDWLYFTDHMTINLGSRVWGLHAPSYGLDGKVEGAVKFSGDKSHVEKVTVTLEGLLSTSVSQRGPGSGDCKVPMLSSTVLLYDSYADSAVEWTDEHVFSIDLPPEVTVQGAISQLPPSFAAYYQNSSCEVSYRLRIDMARRGLRRHESKTISILYLPKTRPSEAPLISIPRPSRNLSDSPLCIFERVKTVALEPILPFDSKRLTKSPISTHSQKSVFFSLPSPQCFSSGEPIPFTLSLVFPSDPFLASMYSKNIRIVLLKRVQLWRKGITEPIIRDTTLASAHLRYYNEYSEGITLLRGSVRAGAEGKESSWCVKGIAETQYILRVMINPPTHLYGHLPSFKHDEKLQITTDSWGTLERELASTGGTPTPALGLASCLRNVDEI